MVEIRDFEDLEARLRRHDPAGPAAGVRSVVLERAGRPRAPKIPRLVAAAASVLIVLTVNLGVERANQAMERQLVHAGSAPILLVVRDVPSSSAGPEGGSSEPTGFILLQVLPTSPQAALLAEQRSVFDLANMEEFLNGN